MIILKIMGGFGNQLFQYSVAFAFAKRTGSKLKLDLEFFQLPKYKNAWKLDKLNVNFEVASKSEINLLKNYSHFPTVLIKIVRKLNLLHFFDKKSHYLDEPGFKTDSDFLSIGAPHYLEGWFNKPSYFDQVYADLVEMFVPKFDLSKEYYSWLKKIKNSNSVSIHIRRNDYINNPLFIVLDIQYYRLAIDLINRVVEFPTFYIFSDDIAWCKNNLINFSNIHIVENRNENADIEDFFLMKECKHNIIANSSYSWWAAYLNQNKGKQVVAPQRWFHDGDFQESLESNQDFLMGWFQC